MARSSRGAVIRQTKIAYNRQQMTVRALFLSCSRAKNPQAGLLPAAQRYDGPAFRVLRRWRDRAGDLLVWVLSAQHGLMPGDEKILDYDRQMDAVRAAELRSETGRKLAAIAENHSFSAALICMADTYAAAFPAYLSNGVEIERAGGKIGGKISRLKTWLGGNDTPPYAGDISNEAREARIGGEVIRASAAQGMALARDGLARGATGAANWQTWFVPVDDKRVGAKWLVAELSGLPVSRFRTADALRVLRAWGIPYDQGGQE